MGNMFLPAVYRYDTKLFIDMSLRNNVKQRVVVISGRNNEAFRLFALSLCRRKTNDKERVVVMLTHNNEVFRLIALLVCRYVRMSLSIAVNSGMLICRPAIYLNGEAVLK